MTDVSAASESAPAGALVLSRLDVFESAVRLTFSAQALPQAKEMLEVRIDDIAASEPDDAGKWWQRLAGTGPRGVSAEPIRVRHGQFKPASQGQWTVQLPYPRSLKGVRAVQVRSASAEVPLWMSQSMATALSHLQPADELAFRLGMARRHTRFGGPRTQMVLARQVARHFQGNAQVRRGAAIIFAYKAIEKANGDSLDEADELLLQVAGYGVEETGDPMSEWCFAAVECRLLVALWHLRLAQERIADALDVMRAIDEGVGTSFNVFACAEPITRTLVMRGLLLFLQGRKDEAIESWNRAIFCFRRAGVTSDPLRLETYERLRKVIQVTLLAAQMAGHARTRGNIDELAARAVEVSLNVAGVSRQRIAASFGVEVDGPSAAD